MPKTRIYLDTSVLSCYYADDSPDKRDNTRKFFDEIVRGEFESFISRLVISEINNAPEEKKQNMFRLIDAYGIGSVSITEEVENLADTYVKEGIIPQRYREDAVHIASAVIGRVQIVISWNMKHMVKIKTINGVNSINKQAGYPEIDLRTPEEMLP